MTLDQFFAASRDCVMCALLVGTTPSKLWKSRKVSAPYISHIMTSDIMTSVVLSFTISFQSIEIGADALLIDEDTCATNFMIRDEKMMQLVASGKEPITPFVRVVRSLYDDFGVSSIIVIGGVGDYFDVADNVIVLDCYQCIDATERAKQIVANSKATQIPHAPSESVPFQKIRSRSAIGNALSPKGKVKVLSQSSVLYGETEIDLSGLEQLVVKSQTAAISSTLQCLPKLAKDNLSFEDLLAEIDARLDAEGLEAITPGQFHGGLTRPRSFEIAGAINRLRRENAIRQIR